MPLTNTPMSARVSAMAFGQPGHGTGQIHAASDSGMGGTGLTAARAALTVAEAPSTLDLGNFSQVWRDDFDTSPKYVTRIWNDVKVANGEATLTSTDPTPNRNDPTVDWLPSGMMVPPTGAAAGNGYGLYQVRAWTDLNEGPGPYATLWPATDKWPGPEVDLFEKASQNDTAGYTTVHFKIEDGTVRGKDGYDIYNFPDNVYTMSQPHTYAMDWTRDHLNLYIDDVLVRSITKNVPKDFADGGQNAAFGVGMQPAWAWDRQTGDTNVLHVDWMSYSAPVPVVPPTVSVADATATEGQALSFSVTLSKSYAEEVSVAYRTVEGTATSADYTPVSGNLVFKPGETTQTVVVQTTQDTLVETAKALTLHLETPTNATIATPDGVGTIVDDDVPGIRVSNATAGEGKPLTFSITLDAASPVPVSVAYQTVNDTAGASDFTAVAGTLTFGAGETSKTIEVATAADSVVEPNETMILRLSSPVSATLAAADGVGTIVNTTVPPLPTLRVSDSSTTEGSQHIFTVSLSAASASPVTVDYQTANGTALAGSDYTANSGKLTFSPGEVSRTVAVTTIQDQVVEPTETFALRLAGPTGATIADGEGIGTILDDDTATPALRVSDASVAEGGLLNFTVSLSAASNSTVQVNYRTSNYTASAPSDYVAKATTMLTFNKGETSKVVSVQTIQDPGVEANEVVLLRLSSPTGATLADNTGTGTILNNDVLGKSIGGTSAANVLTGTANNDVITGGRGNDTMSGLGGEDRFSLSRGDGFDRIKDFTPGLDDLVFKNIAASAVTVKAATVSGVSGTDVLYGGSDHVFLEGVSPAKFSIATDVVFA
jgi:hypothetical protein